MNRSRTTDPEILGEHAIVIGASIGGLLAARVLSERFRQVTVLERDRFPHEGEPRRGVPQGRHAHGLLSAGYHVLQDLFPGIQQNLLGAGALLIDATRDIRWFQHGGMLAPSDSELDGICLSRPRLEAVIRQWVQAIDNVTVETDVRVLGPVCRGGRRVEGVSLDRGDGPETLSADLVVDAGGRGSQSPAWLELLGSPRPVVSKVGIDMAYSTRTYRRSPNDLGGYRLLMVAPKAPAQRRGAVVAAIEDDRWIVTFTGLLGDHPPTDEAGLLAYARSLPTPEVAELLSGAEPLSEIVPFHYPASLRRHYERLKTFPEGYLVIGDALCSFNPIFGQGMTVASLEAQALRESLNTGLEGLWRPFFRRASKVVDTAWTLAASADLAFPQATGRRGAGVNLINAYIGTLLEAARLDPALTLASHRVSNLVAAPTSLFAPAVVWRVVRQGRRAAASPARARLAVP